MALKKQGSRKIIVGSETYRWKVSPDDEPGLGIVVEHYSQPKQRFVLWVDHGNTITPRLVKSAIKYALRNGWQPLERGKELSFRWENTSHHIDLPLNQAS